MTTLREAAQMALDALEEIPYMSNKDDYENVSRVTTTLRAALAQPEQEPVGEVVGRFDNPDNLLTLFTFKPYTRAPIKVGTQLYTAPPQREWQYRRGDRLLCLETEEYCVIHVAGTNRQWIKFPDSHVGVYTNEQVAEMFELLPKEREWVGLTDEEYEAIREDGQFGKGSIRFKNLFEAIEAKLKEKNS